jgi:hypothetical protein
LPNWNLSSPTPFASAVSALSMLAIIAVAIVIFSFLRSRSSSKADRSNSTLYKITAWIGAIDKAIILAASWIIGTRYRTSYIRIPVMLVFFLALTAAAVFAPWPWGMFPIFFGVFSIFCVFRHYSRHEDEIIDEVPKDSRFIKMEGHLQWEVLLAVGFLFVFAPIAFSQLQANGYGFQIAPKAGPFTFVAYMSHPGR